jgi:transglutaminase-like putative cysteine protease
MSVSLASTMSALRRRAARPLLRPLSPPLSRPMSRDKADTLLLLTSCALVLAPHTMHLPIWISLLCASLLVWRGWITFRGNRMPPQWLLLPIAACALGASYLSYHQFFGREPGVAMVVLLLTLKLLEMRAKRDLFVVILVSFFVMMTDFFYSQSIGTALLMIAALIATLTTQLSFQYVNSVPPFAKRLRLGALIFALAVPLALVLFILFPRIEGPLWGLPNDAGATKTGLSSTMAPGSISDLAQSDEIAFRAKFIDPAPPQDKLYWRALVLDNYDGRTWTQNPDKRKADIKPEVSLQGSGVRYEVTLEPTGQHWIFAIDLPRTTLVVPGNLVKFSSDMQAWATTPIDKRARYLATSFIDYRLQADAPKSAMRAWLQLPPGFNPKTLEFAAKLRTDSASDAAAVESVLRFFRTQNFSYTLQPPLLGENAVDEFLFATRAGFCEHYAGAFVFLMRAAGIPARVVNGYQGGEINPVDGYMEIRQADAHAWAEVWLEQRGWVRIDPTAAVAPERVQKNLVSVIPRRIFGGLINLNSGKESWLSKWRFNWGAINNAWNQWVLNYSTEKQKSFLQSLGFENVDWQTMILLMTTLGGVVVAVIAVPLVYNRQKADPVQAVYDLLCRQLARVGYPRDKYEGPRAYRLRVTAADSSLTPARRLAVDRFLQLYESLRYAAQEPQQAKSGLARLKSLFSECK